MPVGEGRHCGPMLRLAGVVKKRETHRFGDCHGDKLARPRRGRGRKVKKVQELSGTWCLGGGLGLEIGKGRLLFGWCGIFDAGIVFGNKGK